ncbi:hypothetical protein TNCV_4973921 [Trichonephila clavipes]|uniref:Uncharacterized protein n=1 Tax=Trichonephila clavipes TaxID=2585209 RepID=A0A8X6SMS9_TRICX|nr:hypothetical protein TNCV_4973921 [Trichonephila clavipes]
MVWRLVGEVGSQYQKRILRKCLARTWVTYEEMLTLLCEVGSVLNGRLLTYVSDDLNEMIAITPALNLVVDV